MLRKPIFYFLLCFVSPSSTLAQEEKILQATLKIETKKKDQIEGIKVQTGKIDVDLASLTVMVKGEFRKNGSALLLDGNEILKATPEQMSRKFEFEQALTGPETKFSLIAVGAEGNPIENRYSIRFKKYEEAKKSVKKSYRIRPGLKLGLVQYTDPTVVSYSYTALGLFTQVEKTLFCGKCKLSLEGYIDGLAFAQAGAAETARLIEGAVNASYLFFNGPFQIELRGGERISIFSASDDSFGYLPLFFPELYPRLIYQMKSRNRLDLLLQFSPLSSQNGSGSYLRASFGWEMFFKSQKSIYLFLEFTKLFRPEEVRAISSTVVSLGFGYTF